MWLVLFVMYSQAVSDGLCVSIEVIDDDDCLRTTEQGQVKRDYTHIHST